MKKSARRKAKTKSRNQSVPGSEPTSTERPSRRTLFRNLAIAAAVLPVVGYFSVQSVQATMAEHDLTRIGNGTPAIVQIHDPNCSLCRNLQRETRAALDDLDSDLLYLVANIKTSEGAALANAHGVPHVTLLLFDGQGEVTEILQGQNTRDTLRLAFADHLAATTR